MNTTDKTQELMHDKDTNVVYLSALLKYEKYGHPAFYQKLTKILNDLHIEVRELNRTNDYWARDYMPIQLGPKEYLRYHYFPDYLVNKDDIETITDVKNVLSGMNIPCRHTNLIIDGGNMVTCGQYIVMTDKVFTEKQRFSSDRGFVEKLARRNHRVYPGELVFIFDD